MKNLIFALMAVVTLSLASCGKQEATETCKECGAVLTDKKFNKFCETCFVAAKEKAKGSRAGGPGAASTQVSNTKAAKFEAERLQIGMEVPDIEGEDVDGVKFKLSDYRGKVIVLDFWGDW